VLRGTAISEVVLAEAANAAGEGIELQDDSFASARYRRRILPVLAERAIRQALASRQVHAD
jgi:CO/xanthine dehydrogenase FAD-binding subunit